MASVNMQLLMLNLLTGTRASTGYYGLPDIYADTDELAAQIWPDSSGYSSEYRSRAIAKLAANPIKATGEYSRKTANMPQIFVFHAGDDEEDSRVGDYMGVEESLSRGDILSEHHLYGVHLEERLRLTIQAAGGGPGQRTDIYLAVRELVLRARTYFESAGASNLRWRGGTAGALYRQDMPEHIIHEAYATLHYHNTVSWTEATQRITVFRSKHQDYNGRVTTQEYTDET